MMSQSLPTESLLADQPTPPSSQLSSDDAEPLAIDLAVLPSGLRGAIEAVLMIIEEPVSAVQLAQVLEQPLAEVAELLKELALEYHLQGRGFELKEIAGGWRIFSRSEYAAVVGRFIVGGQQTRLTQAALETLAVVAYRQPISRARVSAVRGVNVDGVIRTLVTRGLIEEAGTHSESGAMQYRTTSVFLEKLGLNGIEELPPLAPYLPEINALGELSDGGHHEYTTGE